MYVSPEDVAFAEGYVACFFADPDNAVLVEHDDWFTRGDIDFNLHNYSGSWVVDAYEVVNGLTVTDHYVTVWSAKEDM